MSRKSKESDYYLRGSKFRRKIAFTFFSRSLSSGFMVIFTKIFHHREVIDGRHVFDTLKGVKIGSLTVTEKSLRNSTGKKNWTEWSDN